MELMTMKQYISMSKPALIRKITKALRAMPKAKLARLCYNITKSKLPRLRKNQQINPVLLDKLTKSKYTMRSLAAGQPQLYKRRKKKRKFSKKQLAAQRLFAKRARAGTLRKRKR